MIEILGTGWLQLSFYFTYEELKQILAIWLIKMARVFTLPMRN